MPQPRHGSASQEQWRLPREALCLEQQQPEIRSNRSTQGGQQGRVQKASAAKPIPAGRCGGGQVGLGHKVRLAQRLTGAQAAMDRLRVVPAGCRTPLPTPPEAASLLSFRSQLIHYPSEGSLISDAKQPSHHSQRAILVTALSVSAILLLVHCLSLPIRVKVPRGRGSALFFPG